MSDEKGGYPGIATISVGDIQIGEKEKGVSQSKQFSYVQLDEEKSLGEKKKIPKRILHFSDGVLEEYSTDEEDEQKDEVDATPPINPKELSWMSWWWYQTKRTAVKTLYVADTCGEKLAWFFGITSPKYQYAIDEYNRLKLEDQEEQEREMREKEAQEKHNAQQLATMEGDLKNLNSVTTSPPASVLPSERFESIQSEVAKSVRGIKLVDPELVQNTEKPAEIVVPVGQTASPIGGL